MPEAGVRAPMHRGIYAVTDPGLTMIQAGQPGSPGVDDVDWHRSAIRHTTDMVARVAAAGVRVIQVRWKNADAGCFLDLVGSVRQAVGPDVQLIVNDRIDVYLAAVQHGYAPDGVHVGQTDLPVPDVRRMIGPHALLGWSAALDSEVDRANAMRDQLDSIGVGPLRATATKAIDRADVRVAGVRRDVERSLLPVTAIGGIVPDDVEALVATGVHTIAVISAIFSAPDPAAAAAEFVARWRRAQG